MMNGALAIGLTGCILPVIHRADRVETACGSLSQGVPSFIKIGETLKQQVLAELGPPLGEGPGERWVTYGCRISQGGGGVWFGMPMGEGGGLETERFLYKRLIVRFDEGGTVTRADLEEKSCRIKTYARPGRGTPPCIDLSGHDLLQVSALPFLSGEGKFIVYEPIEWYERWDKDHDRPMSAGVAILTERSLIVRSGCDLQLRQPCDLQDTRSETAKLSYSDIDAVEFRRYLLSLPVVRITPKRGDVHGFTVYHRGLVFADGAETKAAAEALRMRVEAERAHTKQ